MFPKSVWVAGHKYRLKFHRLDDNDRGQCSTDKSEIVVDPHNASKTQMLETLFHEIFHAISEHFDLQPDDPQDKQYEHVISCAGKSIVLLMTQNPKLFQHVLAEINNLLKEDPCSEKKSRRRKRRRKNRSIRQHKQIGSNKQRR